MTLSPVIQVNCMSCDKPLTRAASSVPPVCDACRGSRPDACTGCGYDDLWVSGEASWWCPECGTLCIKGSGDTRMFVPPRQQETFVVIGLEAPLEDSAAHTERMDAYRRWLCDPDLDALPEGAVLYAQGRTAAAAFETAGPRGAVIACRKGGKNEDLEPVAICHQLPIPVPKAATGPRPTIQAVIHTDGMWQRISQGLAAAFQDLEARVRNAGDKAAADGETPLLDVPAVLEELQDLRSQVVDVLSAETPSGSFRAQLRASERGDSTEATRG